MFIISRTKVECAGLCLSMMSNGCYGFQWVNLQTGRDKYACKLFKQTKELCSDSDDQIEVYVAGEDAIPKCGGKTFAPFISMSKSISNL